MPAVSVTVDSLTEDRRVAGMTYVFKKPLDSGSFIWLYFTDHGIAPFDLPSEGAQLTIPEIPHFLELIFTAS